jgi:hypothetical protein
VGIVFHLVVRVRCVVVGSVMLSCVVVGSVMLSCVVVGFVMLSCVVVGSVMLSCVVVGFVMLSCVVVMRFRAQSRHPCRERYHLHAGTQVRQAGRPSLFDFHRAHRKQQLGLCERAHLRGAGFVDVRIRPNWDQRIYCDVLTADRLREGL